LGRPSIKFPVAFARPVEHEIELQASQSQVCTNLFLIVVGQIESEEHLDITFAGHLFEYLPDDISFLSLQQLFELVGRGLRKKDDLFDISQSFLPRGTLEVLNNPVSSHTTDKPGEFLRLSHISVSDLFKDNTKCLLVDIAGDCVVTDFPADDAHYDAIIALDQFGLGLPIAGPNAVDEISPTVSLIYGHGLHSLTSCDLLSN
jgi:hypothetical protein